MTMRDVWGETPQIGGSLLRALGGFWIVVLGAFFMGLAREFGLPLWLCYAILALGSMSGLALMLRSLMFPNRPPKEAIDD